MKAGVGSYCPAPRNAHEKSDPTVGFASTSEIDEALENMGAALASRSKAA